MARGLVRKERDQEVGGVFTGDGQGEEKIETGFLFIQ